MRTIKNYWRAFNCDPDPALADYQRHIDNTIAVICGGILAAILLYLAAGSPAFA